MPNKPLKSLLLNQLRRDVTILTGVFVAFLLWLSAVGALSWRSGLMSAAFVIGVGLVYNISSAVSLKASRAIDQSLSKRQAKRAADKARRQILEGFTQPALLLHKNKIEACNEPATRLFSLPAERSGLSIASLRDPDLLEAIEHVTRTGEALACEFNPPRRVTEAWLAELTALEPGKTSPRVLVTMFDQRSVRLAESARADFLANASHELRTPLTSISGFIETMKGPARKDMAAWPRFIDIMDEQVSHMRLLVSDLLSLSRIELNEHVPPTTESDLTLAIGETIEILTQMATSRNITLQGPSGTEAIPVVADANELKQVIGNLLGNALKYTADGGQITVEAGEAATMPDALVDASRRWAGAGRVILLNTENWTGRGAWVRILDNGPGIDETVLHRLGERFFRVDDSRGGPIEGTGLGLAIVKHIMARHQGGLGVESISGQGAAFSVWFPAPGE